MPDLMSQVRPALLRHRPGTWAGNHSYRFARWHEPDDVAELRAVVAAAEHVRVVGSRHSFNDIADTPSGELVSLRGLPPEVDIDAARRVARVTAWSTYAEIGAELHAAGWAVSNLASIPHVSVGGAIATSSHGSGDGNQALGASVVAIELLDAHGVPRLVERHDADFAGHLGALGALGVWTHVHLALEPTFDIRQTVRLEAPWDLVLADLGAVTSAAYSVSMFTDFAGQNVAQIWLKARTDEPDPGLDLGRLARPQMVRMLTGGDPGSVTRQLGEDGPWHERLPHFHAGFNPSQGAELQSEYFVPREVAVEAVQRLRALAPALATALKTAEIRTVARDEVWLSPAYQQDLVGFHFTWTLDPYQVEAIVECVELALLPLGARPHWGKVFRADATALRGAYPRLGDFQALRDRLDPDGVFDNPYLARVLGRR